MADPAGHGPSLHDRACRSCRAGRPSSRAGAQITQGTISPKASVTMARYSPRVRIARHAEDQAEASRDQAGDGQRQPRARAARRAASAPTGCPSWSAAPPCSCRWRRTRRSPGRANPRNRRRSTGPTASITISSELAAAGTRYQPASWSSHGNSRPSTSRPTHEPARVRRRPGGEAQEVGPRCESAVP